MLSHKHHCILMSTVVPASNHYGMFVGGRFLVGMGSNISQGSAPVLVIELAHPSVIPWSKLMCEDLLTFSN